ncbi:carboxymuconolactone decarboxylase family protein [Dehalobacterium formicoaceticum]|uniref:Carboxymuconolactone decarboxylase family protein n=1 Tax=Dehalobacterium formicoaceticum TaxID=51515 RepID=A0ABT1XZU6_9FIRM|nr:carboxymuconolactone decarboxylase family protein [Dehalobacterium formicoaceticum]MCR6544138.1 carboxymuconolactone decarboxylase family protein [Dehalobacterium formicoaceticum]
MDTIESNLKYFTENHGDIYHAYENYGRLVHQKGGPLDEKARWLIKIALSTACQYRYALRTHIIKAIKSGCTREEIEHTIMLAAPTVGFPKTMEGILILREEMGETESTHPNIVTSQLKN